MKRTGSAHWAGDLKTGKGTISTESGALSDRPFGFNTRFGDDKGTNPEELVGAAHAGCFAMAFSNELGQNGIVPDSIAARAEVTLEQTDAGFRITRSDIFLTLEAKGADRAAIDTALKAAEKGCPVSNLFNAEIAVELTVKG
ncbi:OsmC family protein [Hoeflea sp. YIM 152468]|uniref:OsmC family protein n=1 Tax=Hoeflea sp. YIM 152468 TaxID=3031759 RepID=UPI0023D9D17F|nr:OsmC family protein [Hoeflea sp. YIM 152468]MDF1607800.1 OsmC family protein [Hoeflea sp. YIM 152468]